MTSRLFAACIGLACLSACSTAASPKFASYRYQGINLLAGLDGRFVAGSDCVRFAARSPDRTVIAVLPEGTRASADGLRFPAANGGLFVRFDQPVSIQGGFDSLDPDTRHLSNPTMCSGSAFVVNTVERP